MGTFQSRGIKKSKRSHKKKSNSRSRRLNISYKRDSIVIPADLDLTVREFLTSKHHETTHIFVNDRQELLTPHHKRRLEVIFECMAGDFTDQPRSPPPAPIKILLSQAKQHGPFTILQPEFSMADGDRRSLLAGSVDPCAASEGARCMKLALVISLLAAGFSTGAIMISLYIKGADELVIVLGVLILALSCILFFQTQISSNFLSHCFRHGVSSVSLQHRKLGRIMNQELEVV
eukprot:757758-Hanusia_phi.AAC.1